MRRSDYGGTVAVDVVRHLILDLQFEFLQSRFLQLFVFSGVRFGFQLMHTVFQVCMLFYEVPELFTLLHQLRFQIFLRDLHRQGLSFLRYHAESGCS